MALVFTNLQFSIVINKKVNIYIFVLHFFLPQPTPSHVVMEHRLTKTKSVTGTMTVQWGKTNHAAVIIIYEI